MRAKRHGRRSAVALVAIWVAALVAPASANAAVTIGSNLETAPTGGLLCGGTVPCTESQVSLPASNTAAGGLFAPSDGVVVRWRIKVGSGASPVAFRITRPGASSFRTGAGTGPTVIPAANAISEYEVQLPIKEGDAVGIDCCVPDPLSAMGPSATAARAVWGPRLQDGEAPREGSVQQGGSSVELLVNADIEPDCDGDGLGDESQDAELPPGGGCPKADLALALEASKNKVKKGKKVSFSGQLDALGNPVACESGQIVELQRKKSSKTVFATVELLRTTPTGNFSAKETVKKTFEYRAAVAETPACNPQVSNTDKVKVKKPK